LSICKIGKKNEKNEKREKDLTFTFIQKKNCVHTHIYTIYRPIYGLIFLFKWEGNASSQLHPDADLSLDENVYFAKQVSFFYKIYRYIYIYKSNIDRYM